ncbi:MAG: S41 family peptidase [Elusimicrobia bacterium]|nr:S41 family peptidase [Elusimicrobiota bacterium]
MRKRLAITCTVIGLAFLIGTTVYRIGVSEDSPYEQVRILVDILDQVMTNYVEEVDLKDLVYGAASGMLRTLDPFSQFLPPEALKEMKVETEGEFGGIGIRVGIGEDGWLTVVTPLPGTPAFQAGIYPRDRIIKIDGRTTDDITIEKAVQQLRGKPGSKVVLTIERDEKMDAGEPRKEAKDFTLVREVIKIQTIYSRMVPDTKIGHIRITEFNARTPKDIHEIMTKYIKEEGMQALILDLRYNPGGLLPSAIETAKEFIGENKMVVYTQGRRPESRVEYRAAQRAPYAELPLIVLVNEGSASGSEILAGALQDHKRAVLVGARSFGKASVQSVINLPDGSGLRLTTAYYYTPNGRLIHKKEFKRKKNQDNKDEEPPPASPEVELGQTSKAAVKSSKPEPKAAAKNKKEEEEIWGIDPDIHIAIDKETAAKVYQSYDLAYFPDKPSETKPVQDIFKKKDKASEKEAAEKKEEPVRDVMLDRAVELIKAREVLLQVPR